jgi:hypothetical protein
MGAAVVLQESGPLEGETHTLTCMELPVVGISILAKWTKQPPGTQAPRVRTSLRQRRTI